MLVNLEQALNSRQKEAVTMPLGPTMVLAGPGSGKTHVIVHRIEYMIRFLKCLPHEILVITFTRAAADEMKMRFVNEYSISSVNFGTFHSVFYKMLKVLYQDKYNINNLIDESKKRKIIENLYRELDGEDYDDFVSEFIRHMSLMRNQLINVKHYNPDGISKENFMTLYEKYENYKAITMGFDFDDMVIACYEELIQNPEFLLYFRKKYRYILIDEFQDINLAQFEVIKLLANEHKNIFIVGDDDQSIYKFRGAKPEFLLNFEKHFKNTQKVILDINYRSTENIVNASNALISHNKMRYHKIVHAYNKRGHNPYIIYCKDPKDQAQLIREKIVELKKEGELLKNIAVIYRSNIEVRPVMEELISSNISFAIRDECMTLYDQWITKDILAYLRLSQDLSQNDLVLQLINRPSRFISKTALYTAKNIDGPILYNLLKADELNKWQKDHINELIFNLQRIQKMPLGEAVSYIRKKVEYDRYVFDYCNYRKIPCDSLMEVLDELEESCSSFLNVYMWEEYLYNIAQNIKRHQRKMSTEKEGVLLTTMHSAKGLEFNTVFILNLVDGVVPYHKSIKETDREEERRLLYVAMTRAKTNLYLYIPKQRYKKYTEISPFLKEIMEKQSNLLNIGGLK